MPPVLDPLIIKVLNRGDKGYRTDGAVGGRHGSSMERRNDLSQDGIARQGNDQGQNQSQPQIDEHGRLKTALGKGKAAFQT